MRFTAAVQRIKTNDLPSPGKRQTEGLQYSQECQQEVPVLGIRAQKIGQGGSRAGKEAEGSI